MGSAGAARRIGARGAREVLSANRSTLGGSWGARASGGGSANHRIESHRIESSREGALRSHVRARGSLCALGRAQRQPTRGVHVQRRRCATAALAAAFYSLRCAPRRGAPTPPLQRSRGLPHACAREVPPQSTRRVRRGRLARAERRAGRAECRVGRADTCADTCADTSHVPLRRCKDARAGCWGFRGVQ